MLIRVEKGLHIPIGGEPQQTIEDAPESSSFAFFACEYRGLKPLMKVAVGDRVARGQELFVHKTWPQIRFLAPAAGTVGAINRGAYRVLQSIEIKPEGDECESFATWPDEAVAAASRDEIAAHLQQAGLWPALRTRPYSKVPAPDGRPHSIFVTAIDTRPLAADPQPVVEQAGAYFATGLKALAGLTDGLLYLCVAENSSIGAVDHPRIRRVEFAGTHPAGLAGTHIHFLDPVYADKVVWSINYQDVIAIGELFATGVYPVARVISLAGPSCKRPRLIRTRLGASIKDICRGELEPANVRVIAGSVLDGERACEDDALSYLGRFHLQVTALPEHGQRKAFAWIRPGLDLFSVTRAFWPARLRRKRGFSFSCMQNGSERAVVPLGLYERVFPLELLILPLIRSLLVMDTAMAQQLGCLELDEEDLALCSYVCPGKHEFGPVLRSNLERIEKEG